MYKVNGELFSCGITDTSRVPSREGDIQKFTKLVLLNGLSKFAQNFTVGFLKYCFLLTQSTLLLGETSPLISRWLINRLTLKTSKSAAQRLVVPG